MRLIGVVANVLDLDASVSFYEELTPLRQTHLPAWAAALDPDARVACLHDPDAPGTLLRLVQYPEAAEAGAPYPVFYHRGLVKLAMRVASIDRQLELLAGHGISTTNPAPVRDYASVLDPDGITVSYYQHPKLPGDGWFHANLSVDRLSEQLEFYTGVFEGDDWFSQAPDQPVAAAQGPGSDISKWQTHMLGFGGGGVNLDIARLDVPGPVGVPYADARNRGLMWLEFATSNLADFAAALRSTTEDLGGSITREETGMIEAIDPEGSRLRVFEIVEGLSA